MRIKTRIEPNTLVVCFTEKNPPAPFYTGEVCLFLGYMHGVMDGRAVLVRKIDNSIQWGVELEKNFIVVTDAMIQKRVLDKENRRWFIPLIYQDIEM
jgi:hypothetical protein